MEFIEAVDELGRVVKWIGVFLTDRLDDIWIACESADTDVKGHVTTRRMVVTDIEDTSKVVTSYVVKVVRLEDRTWRVRVDYVTGMVESSMWSLDLISAVGHEICESVSAA